MLGLPAGISACLFDLDGVLTPTAAGIADPIDFGYVVGVDRVGQSDALRGHGTDVVVKDLAEPLDQPESEVAR